MTRLSAKTLPKTIRTYSYDRDAVTIGVVHFGIGNFHRAHQAIYCEDLLEGGDTRWGIAGVSLRSPSMQEALAPQDYLYTVATLGETVEYRIIGAIKEIYVAPETPEAVIDRLAKPTTQLVSSTITEKGYYLGPNGIDFDHPDLKAELASLETPRTIYGFLARGLIQRQQNDLPGSKLTILCCDNISGGGEFLKAGVERLLQTHDKTALTWTRENAGFISSMVDRVCPATHDDLRDAVQHAIGCEDAWPVSAEHFRQWCIEETFTGERPAFDTVGATFAADIAPFEKMKLGYLNAAHTLASTLGYLFGDIFVHEALARPALFTFMRDALYKNVLPHAAVPQGYDGAVYIEDVIKRFQNEKLPYANLQVGTDSSQKIQQRWFPTLDAAIKQSSEASYFAFCLGAWCVFIETALANDVLNDPQHARLKDVETSRIDDRVRAYLKIANADKFAFFKDADFMSAVIRGAEDIKAQGIDSALNRFLSSQD